MIISIKKVFLPLFIGIFIILFIPFSSFAASSYQPDVFLSSGNSFKDINQWGEPWATQFRDHISLYSNSESSGQTFAVARVAGFDLKPGDTVFCSVTVRLIGTYTGGSNTLITYDPFLVEYLKKVRIFYGSDNNVDITNFNYLDTTSAFTFTNSTDNDISSLAFEFYGKPFSDYGSHAFGKGLAVVLVLDFYVIPNGEDIQSVIEAIQEQTDIIEHGNAGTQSGINDFNSIMQDFNSELGNVEDFNNSIFDGFSDYSSDINSSISGFSFSSGLLSCATWFSGQLQSYFDSSGEFKMVFLLPFLLGVPYLIINLSRAERRSSRRRGGDNSD